MNKIQRQARPTVFKELPAVAGKSYRVRTARTAPALLANPSTSSWKNAEVTDIAHFHPKSSDHRPVSRVRMLYQPKTLFVDFSVQDQFVLARETEFQALVSQDSCVELFLQPPGSAGYFNFEINCIGTLLLYYIEDAQKHRSRMFEKFEVVPASIGSQVEIRSTLTGPILDEIATPVAWRVAMKVPIELIAAYAPKHQRFEGSWKGNFFKCGDKTSHPHWAAWSDIGEKLRFHQPDRFGAIVFD